MSDCIGDFDVDGDRDGDDHVRLGVADAVKEQNNAELLASY